MRKLLLLAGAGMMLAIGAPAEAKPAKGGGPAKIHMNPRGHIDMTRIGRADWREQRLVDANRNGIADWREWRTADINGNGIPDWRERFIDRDRDGIDDRQEVMGNRWGGATCPPGLEWRNPPCVAPGQAGRLFTVGQRYPTNFGFIPFTSIPPNVIALYGLNDDDRYVYRDGTLYVIDDESRLIERIIPVVF